MIDNDGITYSLFIINPDSVERAKEFGEWIEYKDGEVFRIVKETIIEERGGYRYNFEENGHD